ncbi:MAG: radical SAM protein [Candidatus Thorarchaeota archaeon]
MIEKVRLSIGTAIQLGLETGKSDPNFTTAFLMTYRDDKCDANCAFCPQAQESTGSSDRLSRLSWPEYEIDEVIGTWPQPGQFRRICVQTICYPEVVDDVLQIVKELKKISKLPISVAVHPIEKEDMVRLKGAGVSNIGIALDASTSEIFENVKGEKRKSTYRWDQHIQGLMDALDVFERGNVTTHLIIGLGETEIEATEFIMRMYELGISVGLFAFTSVKGTSLENRKSPDLTTYRRIQTVRHLVSRGLLKKEQVRVLPAGRISLDIDVSSLRQILSSGEAFQVTGCKGCNRPFYNERPRGPMYNYPKHLTEEEILKSIQETQLVT